MKIITAADGFDLLGAFEGASNSALCPVTSVQIFHNPGSGMVPWPDLQNIKIDVSNQLNVNQKVEITGQRIYIVGMTTAGRNGVNHYGSGGSSSGYFFLDV